MRCLRCYNPLLGLWHARDADAGDNDGPVKPSLCHVESLPRQKSNPSLFLRMICLVAQQEQSYQDITDPAVRSRPAECQDVWLYF